MIRRQLPVSSPVRTGSVVGAGVRAVVGPEEALRGLEESLAVRFAADEVVLTGSGTDALTMAMMLATGPARGSALVALPAYSCFDLVTAAVGAGVRVLFYDVDPVHLGPVQESLDRVLELGAGVVIVANLHGYPIAWDRVRASCDAAGAFVIEDAAQGVGSVWRGVSGGCLGDATVLSFGRGKGWTGGGGGALLLRSERAEGWPARASSITELPGPLSWVRPLVGLGAQWMFGRPWLYGIPSAIPALALGETVYKSPRPPRRMAPFVAATVTALEAASEAELGRRIETASRWATLLSGKPGLRVMEPERGGRSAFLRLPVLSETASAAERFASACGAAGIARGYPIALPRLPAAHAITAAAADTPGARDLAARLVTLPTHAMVGDADSKVVRRALVS